MKGSFESASWIGPEEVSRFEPRQSLNDAGLGPRQATLRLGELIRDAIYWGFFRRRAKRNRAEEQLRKLSRAVEQSPASVIMTDVQGIIDYVNPKFCEVTGYTAEEVSGQNARILKSGEMPPETYRQLWETILAGHEWRGEFHNKKKNGESYWEFASISPIKDELGHVTHFVAVKDDITGRKQAEAERERLVGELQEALAKVKTLSGLLPICAWCKKIRDDRGYWKDVETFVSGHSGAQFSHGICPTCATNHFPKYASNRLDSSGTIRANGEALLVD